MEALKVLYRLHHAGYTAYLVGGGVRDLLLGKTPKDFDVVTKPGPASCGNFSATAAYRPSFPAGSVLFQGRSRRGLHLPVPF